MSKMTGKGKEEMAAFLEQQSAVMKAQQEQMMLMMETMKMMHEQVQQGNTSGPTFASTPEARNTHTEATLVTTLISRLPSFEFDLENEKTFGKYWRRHAEAIEGESRLSEAGKRQVLLAKLSD